MDLLKQFFWIILFAVIGDILGTVIPLPIPGAVYGLILFFIFLHNDWVPMEKVEQAGSWLTSNMAIMFVPAGVGIMNHLDALIANWWQIAVVIIVATLLLLALIAVVTDKLSKYEEPGKETVE